MADNNISSILSPYIETGGILFGPGLLFLSPDKEKEIVPLSLGVFIKVTNTGPSVVQIEGYRINFIVPDQSDTKVITERRYPLRSVEDLDKKIYIIPNGITKAMRLGFSENDFMKVATKAQLDPGKWVAGMTFFEAPRKIVKPINKPNAIEIIIKSSLGQIQTVKREFFRKPAKTVNQSQSDIEGIFRGAKFKILEQVDLSCYKVQREFYYGYNWIIMP